MRLQGRGILITGGSLGLGRAVANACVQEGADIFLCARGAPTVEQAEAELRQQARAGQLVHAAVADVSDQAALQDLIEKVLTQLPNLTGVVNAAGINGPKGLVENVSVEDWIATINVNLIGTMSVCRALIPHFRRQGYGKIVNFSGGGATSPHPRFTAYACSKVAVVRLTETLAQELEGTGTDVNAVAPGAVNTRMLDEVLTAGPEKIGQGAYERALKQKADGGAPPAKAAALCVKLLAAESDGLSGKLISAVWDPWETLDAHKADLMRSDVYTLRRILPEDRGMDWGG